MGRMDKLQEQLEKAKIREQQIRKRMLLEKAKATKIERAKRTRALIILGGWLLSQKPEVLELAIQSIGATEKGQADAEALKVLRSAR